MKNIINRLLAILILVIVINPVKIFSQKEEVVAKAGNILIDEGEFKKRFDLSPHLDRDNGFDSTKAKENFLKTLIAEKLLAQDAIKNGLDKSDDFKNAYNYMRNYYLRDALYEIEVKDKVVIPDSDLVIGYKRMSKTILSKFIFSRDEKEIELIYKSLKSGASFDSILAMRSENNEQKEPAEITFGKMNEKVERALFELKAGEFTQPVELKEGWYICKVYSITNKAVYNEEDKSKIKRVVGERIENKIYEAFYKNFFKEITVNADRKLFTRLKEKISKYVIDNEKLMTLKNGKYTLVENDMKKIRETIDNKELDEVFVKFKENPVTFKNILVYMGMEGFDYLKADSSHIKSRLNSYVSMFIQKEIIVREAAKRGYDKLPNVAEDLRIWRENYLSNLAMKNIYKKENVSDEEAYEFYSKSNNIIAQPEEIKIAEILNDDLDVIKLALDEINKGVDFKELAKKYTQRDSLKECGGEYNYQSADKEGKIWEAALKMKIGDVFGPIKLPEGYSLIKLLDRREREKKHFESFEEAKADIKNILRTEKMYKKLNDVTAELALDGKIEINENVLKSIKVNTINMIVFKRFGFGGQQVAFPYTPNFSSWFESYKKLKESLSF
jgi:peptidyl-prolyl cis-trans isomerase C